MRKQLTTIALAGIVVVAATSAHAGVVLTQVQAFLDGSAVAQVVGRAPRSSDAELGVNGIGADSEDTRGPQGDPLGRRIEASAGARFLFEPASNRTTIQARARAFSGAGFSAFATGSTHHALHLVGENSGVDPLDLYLDVAMNGFVLSGPGAELRLGTLFDLGLDSRTGAVTERYNALGIEYACTGTRCVAAQQQRSIYLGRLLVGATFERTFEWVASVDAEFRAGDAGTRESAATLDRALLSFRGLEVAQPPAAVPAPSVAALMLAALGFLPLAGRGPRVVRTHRALPLEGRPAWSRSAEGAGAGLQSRAACRSTNADLHVPRRYVIRKSPSRSGESFDSLQAMLNTR